MHRRSALGVVQAVIGMCAIVATFLPWAGLRVGSPETGSDQLVRWGSGWSDRSAFDINALCGVAILVISAVIVIRAIRAIVRTSERARVDSSAFGLGLTGALVILVLLLVGKGDGPFEAANSEAGIAWVALYGAWIALFAAVAAVLVEVAQATLDEGIR
jgi:hypothetical protein